MAQTTQTNQCSSLLLISLHSILMFRGKILCLFLHRKVRILLLFHLLVSQAVFSLCILLLFWHDFEKSVWIMQTRSGVMGPLICILLFICVWKKIRENTHHNGLGEN